jgi:hypothetical protein
MWKIPVMNISKNIKLGLALILTIFISCSQILAQEDRNNDILNTYDKDTIYLYHDFSGNWFVKDSQIIKLGLFGSNLRREVAGSDFAIEEMNKAKTYSKIGTATGIIATAIAITVTALEIMDVKYSHKRGIYISMVISSTLLGAVSNGYKQSYVSAMSRAVWLYNRDVMSGRLKQ